MGGWEIFWEIFYPEGNPPVGGIERLWVKVPSLSDYTGRFSVYAPLERPLPLFGLGKLIAPTRPPQ